MQFIARVSNSRGHGTHWSGPQNTREEAARVVFEKAPKARMCSTSVWDGRDTHRDIQGHKRADIMK